MQVTNIPGKHPPHRLNRLIQNTLTSGLVLSLCAMAIGSFLYYLHGNTGSSVSLKRLLPELLAANPIAFMVLGVLLLMITPAFRVAVAAIGYLLEGDRTYALISLGVVLVLLFSMMIGVS